MRSFRYLGCRLITVLAVLMLVLTAACGEEPSPTTAESTTTTTEAALDAEGLLSAASEAMAAMSTASFTMVDEKESGAKFFGTTFKRMEADIKVPDSFHMVVDVEAPGFGFVQTEMLAVGDQAFQKLTKDSPWGPLPLDQVPFNFIELGMTLGDLLTALIDSAVLVGPESVDGTSTIRIESSILSEGMATLITTADPGHQVSVTVWIDEATNLLHQLRVAGQLYNDDAPDTTRLITLLGIDQPVDIEVPEIASGS